MARRTYDQFCPVATALDLLGERWTLLVVRELMLGPRRFTDLQAALPGLGTGLLAERLRQMVDAGLIKRSNEYTLTELGATAAPVVRELARFGAKLLDRPASGAVFRPAALALHLAASLPADLLRDVRESYELRVDDTVVHIRIAQGAAVARLGASPDPADLTVDLDRDAFVALALRRTGLADLVAAGRATVTGPADVTARAERLFRAPK